MVALLATAAIVAQNTTSNGRPRASELGLKVGILPTGPLNAITDVAGVEVGHTTIIRGDDVRTGVTAILPHSGNLFREKVPGAVFVGNAFGKLAGSTQVNELGEIETPILLTSTLSVPRVADALIDYMLGLPGNEDVESINPLVGETNDGYLNDIRGRHISRGGLGRRGCRDGGFRLQGRHRNLLPPPSSQTGRVHGWRARNRRRSRRPGTGPLLPARRGWRHRQRPSERIGDHRDRDRCTCGGTEFETDRGEGDAGAGSHGRCGFQRKRRLCDSVLDRAAGADT